MEHANTMRLLAVGRCSGSSAYSLSGEEPFAAGPPGRAPSAAQLLMVVPPSLPVQLESVARVIVEVKLGEALADLRYVVRFGLGIARFE